VAAVGSSVVGWQESLRDQVQDALGPASHWTVRQGRAVWRPPTDGQQWSRAVVLLDGATPIAVAGAFHPRLHSSREWAYVEVAPTRRSRGWGTRALTELRRTLPATARPLRARVQGGEPGLRFAARHGMSAIQRSRLITVTVPVEPLGPGVSVSADVDDTAVELWRDFYTAGHEWDSPGDVSFEVWRELTPRPSSVVRVTRDRVVGIAFVTPDPDGSRCVGGAIARDDPDALTIARQLLIGAASITPGALAVELDDWMWEIGAVVDTLPHEVRDHSFVVAENPDDDSAR
jgi:GNAT superfamily N-acetyltransferase